MNDSWSINLICEHLYYSTTHQQKNVTLVMKIKPNLPHTDQYQRIININLNNEPFMKY